MLRGELEQTKQEVKEARREAQETKHELKQEVQETRHEVALAAESQEQRMAALETKVDAVLRLLASGGNVVTQRSSGNAGRS